MAEQKLYAVAVTAIVYDENNKFLITRRAPTKKKWPGKWTVPGGKLEPADYENLPKDAVNAWYDVCEKTVAREVREEVGLVIDTIEYLTSIVAEYGDDAPHGLIISLIARKAGGELKLEEDELDKAEWVTKEEAKSFDLIDGIYDEIVMAERWLAGDKSPWQRVS